MKILFLCSETKWPGVAFLSSYLKQNGHTVKLLLDHLVFRNEFFHNDYIANLFNKKKLFGTAIMEYKPNLIAISINSSNYLWAIDMSCWIKSRYESSVMVGGILPTLIPDEVLKNPCFDILCMGEGEEPMLEYANNPSRTDIKGLWFKTSSGVIKNELAPLVSDLDKYPMPDDDLFFEQLPWTARYITDVIAGRGCPYNCSFCSNSVKRQIYKGKGIWIRQRGVDNVIKELIYRKGKHKTRIFDFKNEVFCISMQWLKDFRKDYIKYVGLPFYCYFSPNMANDELISILKDCGCRCIHFGLQSGSERVRFQILDRTEKNNTVIKAAQLCHKYGIKFSAHCILNLPGETQDDIRESVKTYNAMRPHDVSVYSLLYLPRSPIIKKAIEEKILTKEDEVKINSGLHNMNPRILLKANKVEGRNDTYRKYAALFTLIPLSPKRWIDNLSNNQTRFDRFSLPLLIIPLVKIFTLTKGGWGMLLPCLFITEFSNAVHHIKQTLRLRIKKITSALNPAKMIKTTRFKYIFLNAAFLFTLVKKRKITFKKITNFFTNLLRYYQKKTISGAYPSVIIFEITNRCNLYCTACRYTRTHIMDQSGNADTRIPLGDMDFEMFSRAIDETSGYLLLALLYLAGEPLLNPNIFKMIKKADECRTPVIISTNGMLLNKENSIKLIESGVDLVKITLSGYHQEIYEKEHRGGDIKVVLDNIKTIVGIKKMLKSNVMIMVDYILFEHNEEDLPLMQKFCDRLGVIMNIRAARTNKQKDIKASNLERLEANPHLCDWLWKTMSVNWDGRVFPCCEYSFWGRPEVLGEFNDSATIKQIWNSEKYQNYRLAHLEHGRTAFQRCKDCHYSGIRFQG